MATSRPERPTLTLSQDGPPLIMGVLNATPDSFSGDGLLAVEALVARGEEQVRTGAAILDLGGESTRPGAQPVPAAEELARVLPPLRHLVTRVRVPLSIDTQKPVVADQALAAGACVLNDVSGLRDPELAAVAARHAAWLVLTHNRWTACPAQDRLGGYYPTAGTGDVVEEVVAGLTHLAEQAIRAGVPEQRLIADPGLGFGKSPAESLELLRRLEELRRRLAPLPLLVGPSRKSFVGRALGLPVNERLEGTLACVALAAFAGAAIIRVHDVLPAVRAARMGWALRLGKDAPLIAEPA
ncbi:MAG: dihydropteroate synthase [Chloroflexi bacterium]|nr:dihydropteroate synthase [Chloroflexota bacterium]